MIAKSLLFQGLLRPIPTMPTVSLLSSTSSPLVLTPSDSNFHEIRAVGHGCSAFLDILSPPYHESSDEVRPGENVRDCTYYRWVIGFVSVLTFLNSSIEKWTGKSWRHRDVKCASSLTCEALCYKSWLYENKSFLHARLPYTEKGASARGFTLEVDEKKINYKASPASPYEQAVLLIKKHKIET